MSWPAIVVVIVVILVLIRFVVAWIELNKLGGLFKPKENMFVGSYGGDNEFTMLPNSSQKPYGGLYWWFTRPWYYHGITSPECVDKCSTDCRDRCMGACESQYVNSY